MEATAPRAITAAATLKPTSSPLTLRAADGGMGRGPAVAGAGAPTPGRLTCAPVLVGGRPPGEASAADPAAVGGRGGGGEPADAVDPETAGPPAGSVGNLMVGDDVGFGGRLIRTVSFFG